MIRGAETAQGEAPWLPLVAKLDFKRNILDTPSAALAQILSTYTKEIVLVPGG
jgi:hypothetical protein